MLVLHDLLGIYDGGAAKFVKRYADLRTDAVAGVAAYAQDVRSGAYPAPEHGHSMPAFEAAALQEMLAGR